MNLEIERSGKALEMPLNVWPRLFLALAVLLVLASFVIPTWRLTTSTADRPGGAVTSIVYRLGFGSGVPGPSDATGGTRAPGPGGVALSSWISAGIAAMALLFARAAVLGTLRSLIDAFVLYVFFGIASLWAFSIQLGLAGVSATARPGSWSALFGEWSAGGSRFASSPATGAWVLLAVVLVLAAALLVSWKSAREELSADFIVAG